MKQSDHGKSEKMFFCFFDDMENYCLRFSIKNQFNLYFEYFSFLGIVIKFK